MTQKTRILIAIVILLIIVGAILSVDAMQRKQIENKSVGNAPAGSIPIFVDGTHSVSITPDELGILETTSFIDAEEGKTQEGWLLGDVVLLVLKGITLQSDTEITITSSSREKSVTLTWMDVVNSENMILLDLSSRGTLKLASKLEGLDTRNAWIQDIDRIDIITERP